MDHLVNLNLSILSFTVKYLQGKKKNRQNGAVGDVQKGKQEVPGIE